MPARLLVGGEPRPNLPSVSLVAVSSLSLDATIDALRNSMTQAQFGATLLLSDRAPAGLDPRIEWRAIRPILSREDYSRFMLHELTEHIRTDFALCVQWDGYVLDGRRWKDEFLSYDYIGAPWPHFTDSFRVGNGGFSLRSKRLLDACLALPLSDQPEDILICRTYRPLLEGEAGIRFAPERLARQFAYERASRAGDEFGFHGVFNMRAILGRRRFAKLLAGLDMGALGRREAREIARQSIAHADWRSAYIALRNRSSRERALKLNSG